MQHIKRKVLQRTLECWTRVLGSGETFLFYYNTEHFLFLLTLNTTFKEKVWKRRDRCWGKDVERWGAEVVFPRQVWIFGVFILLPPMSSEETRRKVQPSVHSAASRLRPQGGASTGVFCCCPRHVSLTRQMKMQLMHKSCWFAQYLPILREQQWNLLVCQWYILFLGPSQALKDWSTPTSHLWQPWREVPGVGFGRKHRMFLFVSNGGI